LSKEVEEQLKKDLELLWSSDLTGPEIAEKLKFGSGIYEKLKPTHVYHYRQKFDLPVRVHHYKYGKLAEIHPDMLKDKNSSILKDVMDLNVFKKYLEGIKGKREFYLLRKRAFLILLFWSGLRKSEVYDLRRREFDITPEGLTLLAIRKKKAKKKVLPLFLPRSLWGIEEAISWVGRFPPEERPFDISDTAAWMYAKDMAKALYPHFFRASKVTSMADDPEMTITKMRAWFGFSLQVIESYLGSPERVQRIEALRQAGRLKRR